jgi:hypothetical protein
MIAEQLWYMCTVYPELVSEEEAIKAFSTCYSKEVYEEKSYQEINVDKSYWEAVLKLIKKENKNEK